MADYTIHTLDTAPAASKPLLEDSQAAYGMIPNLHAVMATSPELLEAYKRVHDLFANTSFNAEELTVVWQTINVEHGCHYCVPAHTAIAHQMQVDGAVIEALRNETPLPTARLEALRDFTLAIVRERGRVSSENVQAFLAAGFTEKNVFEIILGLSQKVMSNYVNHVVETPVDAPFAKFAWTPTETVAAE